MQIEGFRTLEREQCSPQCEWTWCLVSFCCFCPIREESGGKNSGGWRLTFFLLQSSDGIVLIPLKRLMGGLVYPGGMRSWQALLWSAENKREEGGAEEPRPTESHPFISNLCTHTLTHCCTCAQARTHRLHPPTKLVLWSLSQLGPIKDNQDKSITSSTRACASTLPLITLSCQVKQPSAAAPLLGCRVTTPETECSICTGEGLSIDGRNCAFVTFYLASLLEMY